MTMLLEEWLNETNCSAIVREVRELSCYMAVGQWTQAHQKKIFWRNRQGVVFPLEHAKVISLSCILAGDPGSYKSEAVRFVKKVCRAYNDLVLSRMSPTHQPIPIFPYDQVTKEFLLTDLAQQTKLLADANAPCITTIFIDELINFLNRREYVEPLVGLLNSLLDQPPEYAAGTQKRQGELIKRPLVSLFAACAPSWFKYMPEALFTGGYSGRCPFYWVRYPSDKERQPFGQVAHDGADRRLAEILWHLPQQDIVLTPDSIDIYAKWERDFGKEKAHDIQALDEWFKRRAIQSVRWASSISLAHGETEVTPEFMNEANKHMNWICQTLERVWEELDSDDSTRYRIFVSQLVGKEFSESQLFDLGVKCMKYSMRASSIIDYMKKSSILAVRPSTSKWFYRG